jgi:hypothetical protein
LAAGALFRLVAHAPVLSFVTQRHGTARILKKLGGFQLSAGPLGVVPSFFDSYYGCELEFIEFDSRRPAPGYEPTVEMLREWLAARYPWDRWRDKIGPAATAP